MGKRTEYSSPTPPTLFPMGHTYISGSANSPPSALTAKERTKEEGKSKEGTELKQKQPIP